MENFYHEIMKFMPRKFIYFATIHLMTRTTTGKYGDTVVPELTLMEAVRRFGDDNNI